MGIKISTPKEHKMSVGCLVPGDVFEQHGRYYLVTGYGPFCLETGMAWHGNKDAHVKTVDLKLERV